MSTDLRAGRARRRLNATLLFVALLTLVGASLACTDNGSDPVVDDPPVVDPRSGGRLVVGVGSPLDDLVPGAREWTSSELQFARAVYDPLAVYDNNYELQPELAASITPNEDFTDWVIELREDVFFHDSTPLDATTVQKNLEAQRSSATNAALMRPIKSIYVTGPLTLHVAMRAPWSTFPHILTGQPGYVVASSVLDSPPDQARPIGTGPFVVQEWSPDAATVTKNSAYWRSDLPRLDMVDFRFIEEPGARTEALQLGRVDMILTDDPVAITELAVEAEAQQLQLVIDPEVEDPKLTVSFNVGRAPFLDPVARRAVALATDRSGFEPLRFEGLLAPARTAFIPQSLWYNDVPLEPHDVALSQAEQAKYLQTYGAPLSFTVAVPAEPIPMRFAAEWQRQLAVAGITVQIVPQSGDDVRAAAATGSYEAVMLPMWGRWHPDWYYPYFHRAEMTPVGAPGFNYPRFGTLGIDAALDLARRTSELADQVDQYRNVQDELAAGHAYMFLARLPRAVGAQSDVRDLTTWSTAAGPPGLAMTGGTISLSSVWLDRAEPLAE
jgi:peptide/nickel transport system substrate-binding protein